MPASPDPPLYQVSLQTTGTTFAAPASLPLLQSALAAGEWLQSSCRNGTCRSCLCRLSSGQVTYHIAWPGLSAEEKAEGYILACVAYPLSDLVVQTVTQK